MGGSRKNAGFSLIEMLCALLITVFLVMGIGVGMDAGTRVYGEATFEAESATLAGIVNTSIGDILRYSVNVRELSDQEQANYGVSEVGFVFTSVDYGIQDAYFYIQPSAEGEYLGVLRMKNLKNTNMVELVNTGAYPDLGISNFTITYSPRTGAGVKGGYFEVAYDIFSTSDSGKSRSVATIVRLMND